MTSLVVGRWLVGCHARALWPNGASPIVTMDGIVWYGIVEFNVPLDTLYVISETGLLWNTNRKPYPRNSMVQLSTPWGDP